MEEFASRYLEVTVNPDKLASARTLGPIYERQALGRSILLFDKADRNKLASLGEVRTPSISDVFVAVMTKSQTQAAQ
jgi:ABC-2 type transport system ATP-binding protein